MGVSYEHDGPSDCPRIVADDSESVLEIDVRRLTSSGDIRLEFRVLDSQRHASQWVFIEPPHVHELLEKLAQAVRDAPV